jgi:hypothetical protein
MRPWLVPARRSRTTEARVVEAIADQVIPTGGGFGTYGAYGRDPVDGDVGYRRAGSAGSREVPYWTREKARDYSVTAYRSNPMATAIIDTYTAFCVGDSGISWQATNPQVAEVVRQFWDDPANRVGEIQELGLRSQLLLGEKLYELLVGEQGGMVRFAPVEPATIKDIRCRFGNPLWPSQVVLPPGPGGEDDRVWDLVQVDDETGLRAGQAMFWAPWRTLDTDTRGMPFLTSVLDWLDSYDTVLSNLIDRTALARYMVFDVTVQGGQTEVDAFVASRGGLHVPPSGSVEVHNDSVTWDAKTVSTGAMEDTAANRSVLTNIASGTGLAKTWLAEPEDANRATSLTMAEPVRRRVGSVQKVWLAQQNELVRFVVDRAVAAGRLPKLVDATDPRTGEKTQIPASQAVIVTGPEIAASDSQLTAQVLLNLSTGLEKLVTIGALSKEAAATAARKAWEDYVGVPYTAELDRPDANPDDVATAVAEAERVKERHRAGGGPRDYVRDEDGKFAHTPGVHLPDLDVSGKTPAPAPASDPLKLAGRIRLGSDERFTGSAKIFDGVGDYTMVMAGIDGPSGPSLRLDMVNPFETRGWDGADPGTVELDAAGAGELRKVLARAVTDGKASVTDFRKQLRDARAAGIPESQWPNAELGGGIAKGVIKGNGSSDLHWTLGREEGEDYSAGGHDYGPGGAWFLTLTTPDANGNPYHHFNIGSTAQIRKIDKAVNNFVTIGALSKEAAATAVAESTRVRERHRAFDPTEPRDSRGRWTGGPDGIGDTIPSKFYKAAAPAAKPDLRKDVPAKVAKKAPEPAPVKAPVSAGKDLTPAETKTHDAILKTLQDGGGSPGDWAKIVDLRKNMPGMTRREQDQAIVSLARKRVVTLTGDPDRRTLTQAQRDAAVEFGGEDAHIVAFIDPPKSFKSAATGGKSDKTK